MAEYIERETFLKDIEERYCLPCKEAGKDHNGCKCDVCWVDDMRGDAIDAPAADVAPVVHGAWIDFYGDHKTAECSECQQLFEVTFDGPSKPEFFAAFQDYYRYCPDCGARMDGDSNAKAD